MTSIFFEEDEKSMAKTTEAIRQSASKLGLMMSYKKTEILPIGHHVLAQSQYLPMTLRFGLFIDF